VSTLSEPRSTASYRAARRPEMIRKAKAKRRASVPSPQPVVLPRDDGKCRDQESARRLRQMSRKAG
jgi:hypothetical protein